MYEFILTQLSLFKNLLANWYSLYYPLLRCNMSAIAIPMMTTIAANNITFSNAYQTEYWPRVTAKKVKPTRDEKIQNITYFLSWQ
jgi:hypothetical protein